MKQLLESLHEYRTLRGLASAGHLDDGGWARMLGLGTLLGSRAPWHPRGKMLHPDQTVKVSFTIRGGFGVGEIRSVSGGGIAIASGHAAQIGDRTLVRVHDTDGDAEYVFPARVVWRRAGAQGGMGVVFDGPPIRSDSAAAFGWRIGFRLGITPVGQMVA